MKPVRRGGSSEIPIWANLLASPASYLMLVAFVATAAAKWYSAQGLEPPPGISSLAAAVRLDALLFLGLTVVFALIESAGRWLWLLTWPTVLAVASLALANALYLGMAGQQGNWRSVAELLERRDDALMIVSEMLAQRSSVGPAVLLFVALAIPLVVRWNLVRSRTGARSYRHHALVRAACAGALFAVVALFGIGLPGARSMAARNLERNGLIEVVTTGIASRSSPETVEFSGWHPPKVVAAHDIAELRRSAARPNLLIFILESTRFDYTEIGNPLSRAKTPHLVRLRRTGLFVPRMRASVLHTTKSLFTMFCGRLPMLQPDYFEMAGSAELQCLADILSEAGYRTAFYQSAQGTFESRPRLIDQFGFGEFMAGEDLKSPRVGYLSFADDGLIAPSLDFLTRESADERPFLLTLLTSAAHHPYRLSDRLIEQAQQEGLNPETESARYARIVQEQDRILGVLLRALDDAGLLENTIVLATGDHGQAFGRRGLKGHDSVFYEEGLRVPFVLSGPGVPRADVKRNASLLDVMPTLLGLLGIRDGDEILPGRDLLDFDASSDAEPQFFSCHDSARCNGLVIGSKKVVRSPDNDEVWYFDLEHDPGERESLPVTSELEASVEALTGIVSAHTTRAIPKMYRVVDRYPPWVCPRGTWLCTHPNAEQDSTSRLRSARPFEALRVAHAGGGYNAQAYTNSYQALNRSVRKGFAYIELDFSFTSDGHLVCIHDWDESFTRAFGFVTETAPTLEEFESIVANTAKLENCTLAGLARWMRENPSATIITDVKERNVAALAIIAEHLPDAGTRVIPQIYQPANFGTVKALGFESMIWTLYRYRGNTREVLAHVQEFEPPFAITMDKRRARTQLPMKLARLGTHIYVHTVNDPEEAARFQTENGVTEIYTDFLDP
ncbi:MAG: sulfatase-like hydrolase/transferase [Deltaproteobacteria bacterium]|nr:sulfatase-like hydrolase/transferase [Deltaproteobacteria bacterium]